MRISHLCHLLALLSVFVVQGCTAVSTFPTVARAGDTVSVMVGGSEKARKQKAEVTLTDSSGQVWDLQTMGLVRSIFNLRADGRAAGTNYTSYLQSYYSWSKGHEPVQTVLVIDIPANASPGDAILSVHTRMNDDSSTIDMPYSIKLEIIPGTGVSDNFKRKNRVGPPSDVDFAQLEPAPHAKLSFGIAEGDIIGAVSLVIDFDESIVNPDDINVYVPESTVRGAYGVTGAFGETQRMVYWYQDGSQMFIDVIAPQGIEQDFLMMYLLHPVGVASPNFNILSSKVYNTSGAEISLVPTLVYYP